MNGIISIILVLAIITMLLQRKSLLLLTKHYTISSLLSKASVSQKMSSSNTEQLQTQWAGGRDIWTQVPINDSEFRRIQTRVRQEGESLSFNHPIWPPVLRERTLYGFGAYNPRGQVATDEYNGQHHELLRKDMMNLYNSSSSSAVIWWEAASIWEDGSSEKGFIVAADSNNTEQWVVDTATKYGQGAIYKFLFSPNDDNKNDTTNGRVFRQTIPVLDPGTDAKVEVIIDEYN